MKKKNHIKMFLCDFIHIYKSKFQNIWTVSKDIDLKPRQVP